MIEITSAWWAFMGVWALLFALATGLIILAVRNGRRGDYDKASIEALTASALYLLSSMAALMALATAL